MEEQEIVARKKTKLGVRRILNELGDEMKSYAERGGKLQKVHYLFLTMYRAFCELVACVASDDEELINGKLMERAIEMRAKWRELAPRGDEA